jgi:hypothetical protein
VDDRIEDGRITGRKEMRKHEDRERRDTEGDIGQFRAHVLSDCLRALKARRTTEPSRQHRS